jgi:HAE1 family hydrophobic/amphiphilic exporter-1
VYRLKKIIDFSLNNKFAIWILTIMVIVMGLFSGLNMKQEMMPNITLPNLSVITTYPGAAPDEVAEDVTIPIEQRVQSLNGVEIIASSSLANASSIQIQFDYGTDMDKATNEVREAIDGLSLPERANQPEVMRLSLDAFPVMSVSVSDSDHSLADLTATVEGNVVPALEGIDGLSEVQIAGQQMQEVIINFDEDKLLEYGLAEETINQLIQASDITFPLGLTDFGGEIKNLILDGNIATIDDLKALEIPAMPQMPEGPMPGQEFGQEGLEGLPDAMPGAEGLESLPDEILGQNAAQVPQVPMEMPTVQLSELATIEVVSEAESISRTNGEESIGLQIVKSPDANTVEVVNSVKDMITELEEEYGFTAVLTFDQAEPIEESVNTMLNKAIFGILFAIVVILLFLRNIKTTLISVISIPLSLLVALFLLYQMDISLNILTLGALTIAIGRVIDDSIVVMENIYRRMELSGEKLRGKELIREATKEMFVPIFSSTIVTIAVFLPLVLVGGMVGELFLPFALAVVFALAASLLVAVTIVPMLSHSLFKKRLANDVVKEKQEQTEKPKKLANFYKRILDWTLNHKWITFGGATIVLVLSFFLVPVIGVSFLPEDEQKMVIATYSPEPGQTREEAEEIALHAETLISSRDGVEIYQYSLGGGNPMGAMMGMGGDNSALFFIGYDDDFKDFSEESTKVIEALNENTARGEWKGMDMASMGGSGLELYVYGENAEDIQSAVDQILPIMEEHDDLEKVESSIDESYDQYTLVANQEKLSQYGLTAVQIGMNIGGSGSAPVLTTVKHDGKDVNVYIEVEEIAYSSIEDLTDIEIETPLGTTVTLADVVDVEEGKSPEAIDHRDGEMYASLTAEVIGNDIAGVSVDIDNKINDQEFVQGVHVEFGGVTEQINESFSQLGIAMVAAVGIIYFILVVTFGGALAPFAILFSLPFTIIGSLVALWIANEPLSVSAMIGALMLIGIVVTNAIVLIDRVIRNEKSGLSTREALLEAGGTRLRPILMTALATIGALIPLAFGLEGGGLISKGLGVTVMGGLASSTILTLVIVPIVYEVFVKFRKRDLTSTNK